MNQGTQGTRQGSLVHIKRSMSSRSCRQQPLQLLAATVEWSSVHPFLGWTALRRAGTVQAHYNC